MTPIPPANAQSKRTNPKTPESRPLYLENGQTPRIERGLSSLALLGTYLPRQCGIATFTTDLHDALSQSDRNIRCRVTAMNDKPCGYDYPPEVCWQIHTDHLQQYESVATSIDNSDVSVLSIQHEFGIFGGDYGNYLLNLLENISIPTTVTLHTVLKEMPRKQRYVLEAIAQKADRLIVMGQRAVEILTENYGIPEKKIVLIPHGIPNLEYMPPENPKRKLGMAGNKIVLTFGLLSPGKGIEHMIDAMPKIVRECRHVQYIVLGNTHPHIKDREAENYRESLKRRARANGVTKNVVFVDRFIKRPDLIQYISMADVFVTPYLNEAQITSGVLSFGLGLGKAIVSTPYWHAQEALADDRGILVPFSDHEALAREVSVLLKDDGLREQLQMNAFRYSRRMVWSKVAGSYLKLFADVAGARKTK